MFNDPILNFSFYWMCVFVLLVIVSIFIFKFWPKKEFISAEERFLYIARRVVPSNIVNFGRLIKQEEDKEFLELFENFYGFPMKNEEGDAEVEFKENDNKRLIVQIRNWKVSRVICLNGQLTC